MRDYIEVFKEMSKMMKLFCTAIIEKIYSEM